MKVFQGSQNGFLDLEFDSIWSVRKEATLKDRRKKNLLPVFQPALYNVFMLQSPPEKSP